MKRAAITGAGFALLMLFCGTAVAQDVWPMERYDRWGTAKQPVGPSEFIQPWRFFKVTFSGSIPSTGPSIDSNGIGYFGTWQSNHVHKIDLSNGAILGSFYTLTFSSASPALGASPLLVCASSSDFAGGRLFGLNRDVMDYDWFLNSGWASPAEDYSMSPLLGPQSNAFYGNISGQYWSVDGVLGSVLWQRSLGGAVFRTSSFTRDDAGLVVSAGTRLYRLNPATGADAWNINLGSTLGASGVSPNNVIVVGSDSGVVYGVNPLNGAILWTRATLARIYGAPAFDNIGGVEVAYVTSEDHRLYCIRTSDGVRLWSFLGSTSFRQAPIVGSDHSIYCTNTNGVVYKVNSSGAVIWQLQLGGRARGALTLGADGTLYIAIDSVDSLYAIRQTPSVQTAENFVLDNGSVVGGSLVDTHVSDDQYLTLESEARTNAWRCRFFVVSPSNNLYKLRGRFELSTSRTQKLATIQLYNFSLSRWVTVGKGTVSTSDSTVEFNIGSNAGVYVASGTREIRCRLELGSHSGIDMGRQFTVNIDEARFELEPVFQP